MLRRLLCRTLVKEREELKLYASYPALVIFDNFTGQVTERVLCSCLANTTSLWSKYLQIEQIRLQPMDFSVNKAAKKFLRQQFQDWYANKICEQLDGGGETVPINLILSVVKPLGAKWMMKAI